MERGGHQMLDPDTRLKEIARSGKTLEIYSNIPPHRYYRSGLEMVRMANVYLDEGSLENAFILYMKFMTLFIEKIRTHPDFNSVPADVKAINSQKLREVMPKAESLKKRLLEQYSREYEKYLKDMKRQEEITKERKHLLAQKSKEQIPRVVSKVPSEQKLFSNVVSVPPLLDNFNYPSEALNNPEQQLSSTLSLPGPAKFDRSTKPLSLLSPSSQLRHGLRTVMVPGNLMQKFLSLARKNTDRNVETCGILAGQLRHDHLVITHLLVPEQTGTCDSCTTQKEEDLFDYQDQHDLITFGWIHTHPTQTAFLSSVDLHTHCAYQRMMPEAIAIVCAPRYSDNSFFCLTPNYGLDYIANCQQSGFHPHPSSPELFMVAEHYRIDPNSSVNLVDLRR